MHPSLTPRRPPVIQGKRKRQKPPSNRLVWLALVLIAVVEAGPLADQLHPDAHMGTTLVGTVAILAVVMAGRRQ